ncbi:MAG: NAD-dependent epimerase/dehydratase family protein [Candidatus Promineifilaceae bacterium]
MRKKVVLITGAAGEIGQALVERLSATDDCQLLTLDLKSLPGDLPSSVQHVEGDILDKALLARLVSEYEFDIIYHLAALLSTRAEFAPEMAHRVNVDGAMTLLHLAAEQSERRGQAVRFLFPSSIAAYGMPDLETKALVGKVKEWEWNYPTTMYGCNKLYCELLGSYYSRHYHQLEAMRPVSIDFRSLRFPGLISAFTVPSGGTSDYAPEMLHAAAQNKKYDCFVRPDTMIPFMVMPDAVTAIEQLAQAPPEAIKSRVYNVTSFSLTADEVRELVAGAFPEVEIGYAPDLKRQKIVDSWPADLDDRAARKEWGWQPAYDGRRAFEEYLIPNITKRYMNV